MCNVNNKFCIHGHICFYFLSEDQNLEKFKVFKGLIEGLTTKIKIETFYNNGWDNIEKSLKGTVS